MDGRGCEGGITDAGHARSRFAPERESQPPPGSDARKGAAGVGGASFPEQI